MSLVSRVGRAVLWSQVGRVVEVLLFFLFSLFLARTLGPRSYGIYALGLSLATLCVFISLLGIGPETLGKFVPEMVTGNRWHRAVALLWKLLALRTAALALAVVILVVLKDSIAREFHLPWLVQYLGLVAIVFAVRSIYDLLTCFSSALLQLDQVALAKFLASVTTLSVFYLFFAVDRASVQSAFAATASGCLLGVIILGVPLLRWGCTKSNLGHGDEVPMRRILKFGFFAWLTNVFLFVLGDGADALLVGWLVKDPTSVGYYAVGSNLVFRVTGLLLGWVPLVSIPAFSNAYLQGGPTRLAAAADAQWKFIVLSLTVPLLLLFRYSGEIVTLFYSAHYLPSVPVMQILCALMFCAVLFGFSLQAGVLYTLDRERIVCAIVAAAALFNLVVGILLIKEFGIKGAAWATGLSFVFLSVLCAVTSSLFARLRFPWRFILKVVSAALIAVVFTLWLNPASLFTLAAACAASGLVFLFCLGLTKPLSLPDSASLRLVNPQLGSIAERFFVRAA